ncbi:sugar-binding transcriptional regulator [Streptococcus merionis]|uniref:Transcriptional regulator, putative n=1 Tax=Streptococcus merionis TaxID=400065 RepID=A0A239SLR6_9STRE|nr:sugar-binding transcriptional regulator [Streptococcus merionis]SNU86375.1 transcriptional regulator, putative [Streptococcus merionis]
MLNESQRVLAKVAYLYYIENKTQSEIALELNIHRSTVSRMLEKSKKEGIVEITINNYNPETFALEEYCKEKYHLKRIEIVSNSYYPTDKALAEAISKRASAVIRNVISDGDIVGLSWGASVSKAIDAIKPRQSKDLLFCPLAGSPSHINTRYHVNTLIYKLARKFHGETKYINVTAIQPNTHMAKDILKTEEFKTLQFLWNSLDVAIIGIGSDSFETASQWRDQLSMYDRQILIAANAVGDICCRFFDQKGRVIYPELQKRTIGLSLDQLFYVPNVIAIAYGAHKVAAIQSALNQKRLDYLITDKKTMLDILRLENDNFYPQI